MADNIVDIALKLSVDDSEVSKALQDIAKRTTQAYGKQAGVVNKQFQAIEDRVKSIKVAADAVNKAMSEADKSRGKKKSGAAILDVDTSIANIDAIIVKLAELYKQLDYIEKHKVSVDTDRESEANLEQRLQNEDRLAEIEARRLEINKELKGLSSRISKDNEKLKQANEGLYTGKTDIADIQKRVDGFKQSAQALKDERSALASEASDIAKSNSELEQRAKILDTIANNEKARDAYAQEGISEQIPITEEIEKQAAEIEKINSDIGTIVKESGLLENSQNNVADAVKRTSKAMKEALTPEQQAAKEALKNARNRASANYYVLRSLKMTIKEVDNLLKRIRALEASLLSAATRGLKGITRLGFGFGALRKRTESATKSHKGFIGSMKLGFMTILKYTLGIRSFYFLINKLRKAVGDSMGTLATHSSLVNEQMSSLLSNLTWMKNMLATVAQPILNVLVPALDFLAKQFERVTYAVASFFATLTGQSFVYRATKGMEDYAASMDKAGKSAKKLNNNLIGLDELNVINDSSGSGDGGAAAGFEESEVLPAASALADKVKDIFSTLFDPIETAWKAKGQFVMDSWKYALEEIRVLINTIGKDFLTVWSNDVGVQIWTDIFHIIGDVGLITGNLARNFTDAWTTLDVGRHILEQIQGLIAIVVRGIRDCADATVEWSQKLDFLPLLQSVYNLLVAIKPAVQTIVDILSYFWTNVVLPFRTYMIEDGLPKLLDMLGQISGKIDWDLLEERMQKLMDAFEPFLETVWEGLLIVLQDIGDELAELVNSDGFGYLIDKLTEFMENATPEDVAKAIEDIAKALIAFHLALSALKVSLSVIEGVRTFLNFFNQASVLKNLKELNKAMGKEPTGLAGAISGLGKECQTWGGIIKNSLAVGGTSFTEFAGVLGVVIGPILAMKGAMDMMTEGFSLAGEALVIFGSALTGIGLILLGAPVAAGVAVAALLALVWNFIVAIQTAPEKLGETINKIGEWIGSLPEKWNEWTNKFLTETLPKFAENLGKKAGEATKKIISAFEDFPENFKKFIETVDWLELGENIIKGILFIFTLPQKIFSFVVSAIAVFFKNFVKGLQEGFDMHSPSEKMKPYGENILQGILEGILSVIKSIKTWIKTNVAEPIIKGVKDFLNLDTLKDTGANLVAGLKDGISDKWDKVKDSVGEIWNKVTEGAKTVFDTHSPSIAFMNIGLNIVEGLKNGLANLWESISYIWTNLKNQILTLTTAISTGVHNTFSTMSATMIAIITTVSNTLKTLFTTMKTNLINLITELKTGLVDLFNAMQTEFVAIVTTIVTLIVNAFNVMSTTILNVFSALKTGVLNTFNELKSGIKSIINGIIGLVEGLANRIIDGLNTVIDAINNALNFEFDNPITGAHYEIGIDIPNLSNINIPRLAQGAVIPPNQEFLAVLGDQKGGTNIEAPLSTIQDAVALVLQPYLERIISITEDIYEKDTSAYIGDVEIARANVRGQRRLGYTLRTT